MASPGILSAQLYLQPLDGGTPQELYFEFTPTLTDRERELFISERVNKDSIVMGGFITEVSHTAKRGQTYIMAGLHPRGLVIASGYLYDEHPLTAGVFNEPGPGGGEGVMRQITKADPAIEVDAGLIDTVPTNTVWLVHSITATLVTSADAANRQPQFQYRNAADVVIASHAARNLQTASQTRIYAGGLGTPGIVEPVTSGVEIFGLSDIFLPEGFDVFISTLNFDTVAAGDNWGAIQMMVEEWLVV